MIKGIIEFSTIDWPCKLTSVIFTGGCNLTCEYCHNKNLSKTESISLEEILSKIDKNKLLYNNIIISGGEPTLNIDNLIKITSFFKEEGYNIGLNTNGTNPDGVEAILPYLEYISMDIKGGESLYINILKYNHLDNIEKSVNIIKNSLIRFEFRHTVYPPYYNTDKDYFNNLFIYLKKLRISLITIQQYSDPEGIILPLSYKIVKNDIDNILYKDKDDIISLTFVNYKGFDTKIY